MPIELGNKKVNAYGSAIIVPTFFKEDKEPVQPGMLTWSPLDDSGNFIDALEDQSVAAPGQKQKIVPEGKDLLILPEEKSLESVARNFIATATYNSDEHSILTLREKIRCYVNNLRG